MTSQRILYAIFIANFLVFVLVAVAIGGDAINGHEEKGRYFLRMHRMHGRVTEVSQFVFTYSKWHAISVILTCFLLTATGVVSWVQRNFQDDRPPD